MDVPNATPGPMHPVPPPEAEGRWRAPSPARLWLVTSICIFSAEWLIMYFTELRWDTPAAVEVWADPFALVLLVTPLLYFLLFRPMATQIKERKLAEGELRRTTAALRELSARLVTAQEEERKRVARELHEGVGQSLSALKYILERVLNEFKPDEKRQSMLLLRSAVPALQAAVDEVRGMSMDLRPSTLDDLGLDATLRWLAREFAEAHPGIRFEMAAAVGEDDVPEDLKIVVLRILQEALNNAAKHSPSARVSATLTRSGERLVLGVEDDGDGFDPEAANSPTGRGPGLLSVKERAELTGGRFSLGPAPGRGTSIRVEWHVSG